MLVPQQIISLTSSNQKKTHLFLDFSHLFFTFCGNAGVSLVWKVWLDYNSFAFLFLNGNICVCALVFTLLWKVSSLLCIFGSHLIFTLNLHLIQTQTSCYWCRNEAKSNISSKILRMRRVFSACFTAAILVLMPLMHSRCHSHNLNPTAAWRGHTRGNVWGTGTTYMYLSTFTTCMNFKEGRVTFRFSEVVSKKVHLL